MNTHFEIIDPLVHSVWDELMLRQRKASFFHSTDWARVLHDTYGYRPLFFISRDADGLQVAIPLMEIKSMLTGKRGVSMPFSDYCEPITGSQTCFQEAFEAVVQYGKRNGWSYIEIRGGEGNWPGKIVSASYYAHAINLSPDDQQIFASFKSHTRRNIRKAVKAGVEVHRSTSFSAVKEFYRLHCLTRKRHGFPPQPFCFFENIYRHILAKKKGFVMLASYKRKIGAAAVFFHFGEQALYKYGASEIALRHPSGNHLLMWEAIQWFSHNGMSNFCLGRTDSDNNGLRRFKLGWGTEERIARYYRYDLTQDEFLAAKSHANSGPQKIFRKVPVPLSKWIGRLLYKHVG